jgi:O-antigen/teichoic acid export membrane protein
LTNRSAGGYGRGARVLSVGIAATGLVTFAYFALASRALGRDEYARITLVWSVMFVVASVLYRPIEQLLSRTIAERRARGLTRGHPLRVPLLIQAAFAIAFLVAALALRGPLQDGLLDGSAPLYWILVVGVLAYAASYFARGFLAGTQRFELYGGLVLLEACARVLFALAAAVGLAAGQSAVALGMAAAPLLSLVVVPLAFSRAGAGPASAGGESAPTRAGGPGDLTLRAGGGFALAVLGVMLAEQALVNAAVLSAGATASDTGVAGLVFNALLIARVPLQLFQAVQGSLLPHLAGLQGGSDGAAFSRAIRTTLLAIAGFASLVAAGLLAVGPPVMDLLFGDDGFTYPRLGLALVGLGMGCHLAAGTLNQAALARRRSGRAAVAWLAAAALFVAWTLLPVVDDVLLRAEVGYLGATAILCVALALLVRPDLTRR